MSLHLSVLKEYFKIEIFVLITEIIFFIVYRDTKKLSSSKIKNVQLLLTKKKLLEERLKMLTAVHSECTYADPKAVDEDVSNSLIIITWFLFCMSKMHEFVHKYINHI